MKRLRIDIHGAVQGVGFRPFVYRQAKRFNLNGWIRNNALGVNIEAEGEVEKLNAFLCALQNEAPTQARIHSLKHRILDPAGYTVFKIMESVAHGQPSVWISPDIATCTDCLKEIFDPVDRRYLYPFTNCTHCGPRFSIIQSMPYDRPNTSMNHFMMCSECRAEYENPNDRRFHAQPNACSQCGPHLELWDKEGECLSRHSDALDQAIRAILDGEIVAVKGLGGFHLMTDATNREAVLRLRERKHRDEKPFALMVRDIRDVESICCVSEAEKRWLTAPESPILLLLKKPDADIHVSADVAPENPCLGVMLPYTPLHHILLKSVNRPLIATSGNLSEEPICTDNIEALNRLKDIADIFLGHNRLIVRPVDDSVGRMISGRQTILRRSRGYAPLPIMLFKKVQPVAAFGGHLKNTLTLASQDQAIISQHIGDLESESALRHFRKIQSDLKTLFQIRPDQIVHDLHPDYMSTHEAQNAEIECKPVQHHLAHVLSCMLENEIEPPVLGITWDGTGYGTDGAVWGGEFIFVDKSRWKRVATFRQFPLAGGDQAIREPRRSALGLLHVMQHGNICESDSPAVWNAFKRKERDLFLQVLAHSGLTTMTSSAGRIFDAVASILNIRHINQYEGQAAMQLEFAAWQSKHQRSKFYPFAFTNNGEMLQIDWEPMIREILRQSQSGIQNINIADRFHSTLADIILNIARKFKQKQVVLSGGCFQNKLLTERTIEMLTENGFNPYWHQRIPPNDGGISLGQIGAMCYGMI